MKAGLEIHQQLDVGKLFSGKRSLIEEGSPDSIAYRTLHLTASELGVSDAAAAAEIAKDRTYEYHAYRASTGLVELDEEPPSDPNPRALAVAFAFAELCNAQLIDEIVPMRKIVVDGSNTSGFQRTMLYAMGGTLTDPETDLEIPIPSIMLEEDSGKRVDAIGEGEHLTAFNLSRLGIPLLEITTDPVFSDPDQLKSGALLIGSSLRLLPGVKRGLGTIRQDVNISIEGGARVEIKGAQDVRTMDDLARQEVTRQESLIAFAKDVSSLEIPEGTAADVTETLKDTEANVLRSSIDRRGSVLACKLTGWAGNIGRELSPNNRVGTELSGYVKAHTGLKGLFHSDELPRYGITEEEVARIREALNAEEQDAFLMIAAPKDIAQKGLVFACERLRVIAQGVPSEVRRAKPDNATEYLREMPGAARMYPETDVLPFASSSIAFDKPRTRAQLEEHYRSLGLNDEFARIVIDSPERSRFDELAAKGDAALIFKALFLFPKEAKARHNVEIAFDNKFEQLLDALLVGDLIEDSFVDALVAAQSEPLESVLEKFKPADESEIRASIEGIVAAERKKNPDVSMGALMGAVMRQLGGRISGKEVQRIIGEL